MNQDKYSGIVLVLSPSANDGQVACRVLAEAGIPAEECRNVYELSAKISNQTGAILLAQEALTEESINVLEKRLSLQEAWSDLPILVMAGSNLNSAAELFSHSGNISLLERPFSRLTFVRAVKVALRSRAKQYEVCELLEKLHSAKEDADRANAAKTQFLANMSHEIRSPIGAIMGFVELLRTGQNTPSESAHYMGVIDRNSQQLLRLIDDILDLAKVEAGKTVIEKISFKLTDMLADIVSVLNYKDRDKGIDFRFGLDTPIMEYAISDPVRLRQILMNIAGNAIKFTESGWVELKVRLDDRKLSFQITDTGIGLSESQAQNLFQPFMQADSSTTRRFGGTGLGLALSRNLAQSLDGAVSLLWSAPGEGSSFLIEVQVGQPEDSQMVRQKDIYLNELTTLLPDPGQRLSGLKVLMVEDSPDNQILISTYLKKNGAVIEAANDGVEGVAMALKREYDVVLMDIQMPRMDGHTAAKKLRQSNYSKPIIALTAHAMKEERARCVQSGFTDFLTKPIQAKRLIEVLSRFAPAAQAANQ